MELRSLSSIVPASFRRAARERLRVAQLSSAMRELDALADLQRVEPDLIERLRGGWGNEGWSADSACLRDCLREASVTDGPILECGSGLTTLLLGVAAKHRDLEVWSLEHDPAWLARTTSAIRRFSIDSVRVLLAPIVDYGSFAWYAAPFDRLPPRFSLVICDGPPGDTPGGRYGLLPLMRSRLGGAVIVVDDAHRQDDAEMLDLWQRESGWTVELRGTHSPHAIVRCT